MVTLIAAIIAAHDATANLKRIVPAPPGRDGWFCSNSPFSVHDPGAVGPDGRAEDIVGIAKVMHGNTVVGFVYRMKSGRFYAQALGTMPYGDQAKIGLATGTRQQLEQAGQKRARMWSGLKLIHKFPWTDLNLEPCSYSPHRASRHSSGSKTNY